MKFGLARTKKFKKSFKKLHLKDNDEAIYIDVVSKLLNGIALESIRVSSIPFKGDLCRFVIRIPVLTGFHLL